MIVCFAVFLAGIAVCLATGADLLWAMLLGLALFFLLGCFRKIPAGKLLSMAWSRGRELLPVIPIYLLIGAVTALWRSAGTIPAFLYYGLDTIPPRLFLLMAFLLSAILSYALGSNYGVVGTAGIVLMALARSGGVNPAMAAGVVLSGACFGYRSSPMSSWVNLLSACTGVRLYDSVRELCRTAVLPMVLTTALYGWLSFTHPIDTADARILSTLAENFSLQWIVLLPAVLILVLPLLKVPVKWVMAGSAATAFLLSVTVQGQSFTETIQTALFGYAPTKAELQMILAGGGAGSMVSSSAVIVVTGLYAGMLEGMDVLPPAQRWAERLVEKIGLFPAMALINTLLSAIFCNQSAVALMDEQLLADSYRNRGSSRMELAMDIANSNAPVATILPWNISCSVPLTMMEVGAEAIPFALLPFLILVCYLCTRQRFLARQNQAGVSERI